MRVKDVQIAIEGILRAAGDDELQHQLQADLWKNVLTAIAEGNPDAIKLAAAALETETIDFSRWFA